MLPAIANAQQSSPQSDRLFSLVSKRLQVMKNFAAFKALHHMPVEDLQREKLELAATAELSARYKVDPASAQDFLLAQVAAAKAIQYRWRAYWQTGNIDFTPPDLYIKLRPDLMRLNESILEALHQLLEVRGPVDDGLWPSFEKATKVPMLTLKDQKQLFNALKEVRLSTH